MTGPELSPKWARLFNIEVLYSDHDNQLILVVDDLAGARAVSEAWSRES